MVVLVSGRGGGSDIGGSNDSGAGGCSSGCYMVVHNNFVQHLIFSYHNRGLLFVSWDFGNS